MPFAPSAQGYSTNRLTQIRKHIRAVVIVPRAGAIESIEVSRGKSSRGDWQCNGHIQSLLAGKANATIAGLIRVLIAEPASAFDTSSQRRIFATMRHKIANYHFTLFSHSISSVIASPIGRSNPQLREEIASSPRSRYALRKNRSGLLDQQARNDIK